MAVAMMHIREPVPSVRDRRPDVSPRLDAIVARGMAKRPEDRFPSTDALMAALEAEQARGAEPGVAAPASASANGATEKIQLPSAPPPPSRRQVPRRRMGLPLLIALLAAGVVALVVALIIAGGGAHSLTDNLPSGGGSSSGARVQLHALSDFDPDGDGQEHPETVPAATDGDASTYWTTETYSSFAKAGVGIVLDARKSVDLAGLTVTTDTPGFTAVVQASNRPDGGFKTVSDSEAVANGTTFDLKGGDYRYYLIWITSLEGRAHINEVKAKS